MIRSGDFWKEEKTAPLMQLNDGFLSEGGQSNEFFERFDKWVALVGAVSSESDYENKCEHQDADEAKRAELLRIVEADAVRTFFGTENRKKLVRFITVLRTHFKDYHQGLGYIASFLLLVLDETKAFAILDKLNSDPKYIPGYWRAEAVALSTDAHVFNEILKQRDAQIAKHLADMFVFPGTYCQKWFAGLNVHVLPFRDLCDFLELFFTHGYKCLIQFGLSLMKVQRQELLVLKSSSEVYSLLRLDAARVPRTVATAIVNDTRSALSQPNANPFADVNFDELRVKVFERDIKPSLERAAQAGVATAGESDEDSDWSDEEGAECHICQGMPEHYCKSCAAPLCGPCHDKSKKPHARDHVVEDYDFDNALHNAKPNRDVGDDDDADANDDDKDADEDDKGGAGSDEDEKDLVKKMEDLAV